MKKISLPTGLPHPSETYAQKTLDRLLVRTDIRQFVKQYSLTIDHLNEGMLELLKYEDDALICEKCPGILKCPKNAQGFRFYLDQEDNKGITLYLAPCAPLEEFQKVASKYVRRDSPDEWVNFGLSDVKIPRDATMRRWLLMNLLKMVHQPELIDTQGYYLFGPAGTGKSFILSVFLNECARNGKSVAFIQTKKWMDEMRMLVADNRGDLVTKQVADLAKVDVLVWDGLGKEKMTDWARDSLLLEVLDTRSSVKMKRTFFTSPYNLDELMSHYHGDENKQNEKIRWWIENHVQLVKLPSAIIE